MSLQHRNLPLDQIDKEHIRVLRTVHGALLAAGADLGRDQPDAAYGHHALCSCQLLVQVKPLPIAVFKGRRIEIGPGGSAVLLLQLARRRGDVRPVTLPAFGVAAPAGFVRCRLCPQALALRPVALFADLVALAADFVALEGDRTGRGDRFAPLPRDDRQRCEDHHHQRRAQPGDGRAALAPAIGPLQPSDRPRQDRLVGQPAPQVGRQLGRRRIPPRRGLLDRPQADRFQIARDAVVEAPRLARLVVEDLVQEHPLIAAEGEFAR